MKLFKLRILFICSIIIIVLIALVGAKQLSTINFDLPKTNINKKPCKNCLSLHFSKQGLYLNGRYTCAFEDINNLSVDDYSPIVYQSFDSLYKQSLNKQKSAPNIKMIIDKSVIFGNIYKIMNTAGKADIKNFYFVATNSKSNKQPAIFSKVPSLQKNKKETKKLITTIIIYDTLLSVGSTDGAIASISITDSNYDSLKIVLKDINNKYKNYDDINNIIIGSKNHILYDQIFRIMEIAFISGFKNIALAKIKEPNDSINEIKTDTISKKGAWGIGYGKGYGKSVGTKNIDSLIDKIFDTTNTYNNTSINRPKFTKGGALKGKRSRKNIMKTVIQNLPALRYMYNKRLKVKPDLKGRITTEFKINHLGKVISCKVVSTTMNDKKMEKNLVNKIKKWWDFGKIPFPNDTTVVTYPFVFTR